MIEDNSKPDVKTPEEEKGKRSKVIVVALVIAFVIFLLIGIGVVIIVGGDGDDDDNDDGADDGNNRFFVKNEIELFEVCNRLYETDFAEPEEVLSVRTCIQNKLVSCFPFFNVNNDAEFQNAVVVADCIEFDGATPVCGCEEGLVTIITETKGDFQVCRAANDQTFDANAVCPLPNINIPSVVDLSDVVEAEVDLFTSLEAICNGRDEGFQTCFNDELVLDCEAGDDETTILLVATCNRFGLSGGCGCEVGTLINETNSVCGVGDCVPVL